VWDATSAVATRSQPPKPASLRDAGFGAPCGGAGMFGFSFARVWLCVDLGLIDDCMGLCGDCHASQGSESAKAKGPAGIAAQAQGQTGAAWCRRGKCFVVESRAAGCVGRRHRLGVTWRI